MRVPTVIVALAVATALGACSKKENPVNQAAQDIKAMGEQRDKAKEAVKEFEATQQKAAEAETKAADGEEPGR